MQEKERDLRTLPEIWGTLTKDQKDDVARKLIADGWTISRQTVWNWATGKWKPRTLAMRNGVAASIGSALGVRVFGKTLFPAS